MPGSDDVVPEYEVDNVLKGDAGDELNGDADSIICTVIVQSSSTRWHRSVIIPS